LQTLPFVVGDLLALLNPLPAAAGGRQWVDGSGCEVAVDTEEALEVRHLAAQRHAGPKGIGNLRLLYDVGMGAKERNQGVVLTKLFSKELADCASVEASEPIEFDAGHCPVPEFHLGDR
jgi:hypothetical protein